MTEPPSAHNVLGVDYGRRRVGTALGFLDSGLVIPLGVVHHPGTQAALVELLAELVVAREVDVVVLGKPLHADGRESPMSAEVAELRAALLERLEVPVEWVDERHSSQDAEASLKDAGLRWWQVEKGRIDALAAMAIARSYLHAQNPELALTPEPPAASPEPFDDRRARRQRLRRKRKKDD
ncbi:MAG: Holliday junction resolvase RuvX [Planctomycetes bacterium]|nr:Holliday junction resolvase RuvX [Planctomycetota bacterium]